MLTLGIIRDMLLSNFCVSILYSESLKESVHTKISFCSHSTSFDLSNIPVKTGLKFFSTIAYSTFSIHSDKLCVGNFILLS